MHRIQKKIAKLGYVEGYVVKGFFPRGEEWMFVSKKGDILYHSFLIDYVALYVRKLIQKNSVTITYNTIPQPLVVDHVTIKMRPLLQDEIIFFTDECWEARKKVHKKMPRTIRQVKEQIRKGEGR